MEPELIRPTSVTRLQVGLNIGAILALLLGAPQVASAQGLVKGMQDGAQAGNKAAGPVGGVLGGAIGGVVGVFNGALGVASEKGQEQPPPAAAAAKQIVANSDAYIDRIKAELSLTPEQEKNWSAFNSAMHYLGHNGAERLNLRIARAKRDPPDDIVEQMRNEAQFLVDRAADQRAVADAAEPLFTSLDDKQKAIFIEEMVRLSHERGLD
jgi:hypothetical protein